MNESAFQSYVKTFPGADPSLGALQCYVQSSGEREERMMGIPASMMIGVDHRSSSDMHTHVPDDRCYRRAAMRGIMNARGLLHYSALPPPPIIYILSVGGCCHRHSASLALHATSPGHAGTIYRSTYKVKNDKGRVLVSTHSYTTLGPENKDEQVLYVNMPGMQERPLVRYVGLWHPHPMLFPVVCVIPHTHLVWGSVSACRSSCVCILCGMCLGVCVQVGGDAHRIGAGRHH